MTARKDEGQGSGAAPPPDERRLIVGQIAGVHGVKGWVKVFSYTQPMENILEYSPWQICLHGQWQSRKVLDGRRQGKGLVARLEGLDDRDAARGYIGADVAVLREQLPSPEPGEYYWTDLIGLEVVNEDGFVFGLVDHLFATGANDVLVVRGDKEYLIPFVQGQVIKSVDLAQRVMRVDWFVEL